MYSVRFKRSNLFFLTNKKRIRAALIMVHLHEDRIMAIQVIFSLAKEIVFAMTKLKNH